MTPNRELENGEAERGIRVEGRRHQVASEIFEPVAEHRHRDLGERGEGRERERRGAALQFKTHYLPELA